MKRVKVFNIIMNVITIGVYLITTILTSYLLIRYSNLEKTEGSGLAIAMVYFLDSFVCLIEILLNIIGIGVIIFNKDKVTYNDIRKLQYKKQLLLRVILIIVPILTFIIQIINKIVLFKISTDNY
jgi:hypothetical protein